jgi:MYXO-CTERM domain-containing protein
MPHPLRLLANVFLVGMVLLGACAPVDLGVSEEAIAVPGPWAAPASTLTLSNPQYVEVVDPPSVEPLGHCTSTNPWAGTCSHPACIGAHPGTEELANYIYARWPYARRGGNYSCRRNSNPSSTAYLSVHSVGRAIDVMIPQAGGDADNTAGDAIANWLIENAEYVGIQRVIWDGWYWNGSRRGNHFSPITGSASRHTDHIHVEVSVDGAHRRTRFFTDGAPPATCPIVCYGSAAVRADCSYVDCAASGQVCMSDPVRCETAGPPEPSTAIENGSASVPSVTTAAALSRFAFTTPTRLFDTRTVPVLARADGTSAGPLMPDNAGVIPSFASFGGDTTGVWLNLAAVPRTAPGFLTAFASGPQPSISTLNYAPGRVRANAAAVPLSAGGITIASNTDVDVIGDLSGRFATAGLGLLAAGPRRVLDTRSIDAIVRPNSEVVVDVLAPDGALGVVTTLTVIQGQDAGGFLTAYPCGTAVPITSNVNFVGHSVTANTVIAPLTAGDMCFSATQPVHVVIDVTGYLVPEGELSYQALAPVRILDTRSETARYVGRLGAGQTIELPIQAMPGMPADVHAVTANITTISPGERGFITAFPCGTAPPGTSSLNFDSDDPAGAVTFARIGDGGTLCLYSNARAFVIVDLLGVWVPTPGAAPPTEGEGPIPETPEELEPGEGEDGGVGEGADGGIGGGGGDVGPRAGGIGGGCQVGAGEPDMAAWLSMLLALGIARRRRRR